jgi:hypothetical protein
MTYRVPFFRIGQSFLIGWSIAFGIVVVGGAAASGAPLPAIAVMAVFAVGFAAFIFWYLNWLAYELKCSDDSLTWKTLFRSGSVPLGDLRRIRWGVTNVGTLEVSDGRRIRVLAQKGFGAFATKLADRCPSLAVQISWLSRLQERFPGWTAFRKPGV